MREKIIKKPLKNEFYYTKNNKLAKLSVYKITYFRRYPPFRCKPFKGTKCLKEALNKNIYGINKSNF